MKGADNSEYKFPDCTTFKINPLTSSKLLKEINNTAKSEFILLLLSESQLEIENRAFQRISSFANLFHSGIIYSDYFDNENGLLIPHTLIDYQTGSVRDNFNFGHIMFLRKDIFSEAVNELKDGLRYAGLYNLRLNISLKYPIIRIPECLYIARGNQASGNQFEYVDSKNREVQIEMEQNFTDYLKKINALLKPPVNDLNLYTQEFRNEVSVIIPVKNRFKTISDAINSALSQKTDFTFNLIVVDNYSDDGTTEVLKTLAKSNRNLIHLIPDKNYLGIGGCWNEGIHHPDCGRFAVQLDSDDIYSDENTLQKIVDVFRKENCAMVIGSYILTDFQYNQIPPGIIDHREWTEENGPNNALRINGFGAPRAFFTPIIRKFNFPNVSYGEDYSAGLAISRCYKIGRIYDPIYICRRWEGNSDSFLSIEKENGFNCYKDKIRTFEILIRQQINTGKHD